MFSKTNTPAHQSHERNVRRYVTQDIFHIFLEELVVFEILFQGFTVINEFQGCHQLGKLFDERVGDVVVGFVQLFRQIIFVNFFHGLVRGFFDVLCRMFDLTLCDESQHFFSVANCFSFFL